MRPNKNTMNVRLLVAALAAVCIVGSLTGCGDPTKPQDVKYNLYVGAANVYTSADSAINRIYIYDGDSLTLLDSISVTDFPRRVAISPDGRWLYVTTLKTDRDFTLRKVDVQTRQEVWSRDGIGGARFLDNGKVLLAGRDVIQPEDGALVRHLSDTLYPGWGPVEGTRVAAVVPSSLTSPGNDSIVTAVDVATGQTSGKYVARLSSGVALRDILTATLHPDGRRLLEIGVYGYTSWFVVGDVVTGQTLFEYRINYSGGEITISTDGTLAAVTDPGTIVFGEYGLPYVVDLRTYSVRKPDQQLILAGGQVRFLPDNKRILTAPTPSLWDGGPLQVIDLTTMTVEKSVWPMGYDPQNWPPIGGLAIGPRP